LNFKRQVDIRHILDDIGIAGICGGSAGIVHCPNRAGR
jgi:hypothetical protein